MKAIRNLASSTVLVISFSVVGVVAFALIMSYVLSVAGPIVENSVISLAAVVGYGFVALAAVAMFCGSMIMLSTTARFTTSQWFAFLVNKSKARKKLLESEFEFKVLEKDQQGYVFSRPDSQFVGRNISLESEPFTNNSLPSHNPISLQSWAFLNAAAQSPQIENGGVPMLEATPLPLPTQVNLTQILPDEISLNNLVLGVTHNDKIITDSLKSLTHIAIAGSTRWGKSIFAQMLLYQIAMARQNTKLYLGDLSGTSFVDFGLPYASTLPEVESLVGQVMAEAEHRKELYQATGQGIKSLDMYNRVTGDNLPHIVMVIDEALFLMTKSKTVKENLEIAVSWAAKYGATCLIVSQDWKSDVMGTATRNNFSSRFQFLAEDKTQANVLIKGSGAHTIENKGRCFSRLPGNREIIELQTPYISEHEIQAIAPMIQAKNGFDNSVEFTPEQPEPDTPTDEELKAIEAFVSVRDGGKFSWRKATQAAYGNGKFGDGPNKKMRSTLDKFEIDYQDYI